MRAKVSHMQDHREGMHYQRRTRVALTRVDCTCSLFMGEYCSHDETYGVLRSKFGSSVQSETVQCCAKMWYPIVRSL